MLANASFIFDEFQNFVTYDPTCLSEAYHRCRGSTELIEFAQASLYYELIIALFCIFCCIRYILEII